MNRSCFLCLAACRTRLSAWVTRFRLCVRYVLRCSAFPSVPAPRFREGRPLAPPPPPPVARPRSAASSLLSRGPTSRPRSSPASAPRLPGADRRGTGAARPDARSLRFRRDPSQRDVVFDPGRAIAPRIAVRHMLPSACSDGLGLCDVKDFVAQYTPRQFAVIRFAAPVAGGDATTRYQAGATRYLGRTSTGWTTPAR